MGSPVGEGSDDEHPQRRIYVDAFYIDKYEMTNSQFQEFVNATGFNTTTEKKGWSYAWNGIHWGKVEGASWRHPQ